MDEDGDEAKADFREEVIQLLESTLDDATRSLIEKIEEDEDDPLVFAVVLKDDTRVLANLEPIHAEIQSLDEHTRERRLDRHVRGLIETLARAGGGDDLADWDEVKHRLVPLLRAVQHYAPVPLSQRPPSRRFDTCVVEIGGIDFDDSIRQIDGQQLQKWSRSLDEVLRVAAASFGELTSPDDVERLDNDGAHPVWHVARDNDYASSCLLLPGWLASFRGKVPGRPIAIVPERNQCIVSGDGDPSAVGRLIELARAD